jgi:hypothetical protein
MTSTLLSRIRLTVVAGLHAERAGIRVANVDVHDGGAGLRGRDGGGGDLFGRDRAVRALGDLGVVAGDGAADDDVVIHGSPSSLEIIAPKFILYRR